MTDQPTSPSDIPLKTDQDEVAGPGHNNPPAFDQDQYDQMCAEVRKFANTGGEWLDLKVIETEEQAQYLVDFIAGLRKQFKIVESARRAAKEPHDLAGKTVQSAFAIPKATIETTAEKAKDLLKPYLERKRLADLEAKRQAEEKARLERLDAERKAAAAAERNDIAGQVEAAAEVKAAEKAEKSATKPVKTNVGSATGGGRTISQRTTRTAEITNINTLFLHYRDHPKVAGLLTSLANTDIRSTDVDESLIKGIKITEKRSVA